MKHYGYEIYENTEGEIVIKQDRCSTCDDDIFILLTLEQVEDFIHAISAAVESLVID